MKQPIADKQSNDAALKQIFEIFGTSCSIFYDKLCLSHVEIKYNLGKMESCIFHYNKILVQTETQHTFYWPIADYARTYLGEDCQEMLAKHFQEFPFCPIPTDQGEN